MTIDEQVDFAARLAEALDKTPGNPTLAETSADYLRERRDGEDPIAKADFNAKLLAALDDPEFKAKLSMIAWGSLRERLWLGPRPPLDPLGPPITLGAAEYLRVTDMASCPCGKITVTFDPMAARGLTANEVRQRWPRGQCQDCKTIVYASAAHYIEGDW